MALPRDCISNEAIFQMGQVCGIEIKSLEMGASCQNDNDLVLYLSKDLQ